CHGWQYSGQGSLLPQTRVMKSILEDLRFSVRGIRRAPLFAAVVILSLGVPIGAVTAMFRIVDAFDIHGLRYLHADRLVTVVTEGGRKSLVPGGRATLWTEAVFNVRERAHAYDELEGVSYRPKRR